MHTFEVEAALADINSVVHANDKLEDMYKRWSRFGSPFSGDSIAKAKARAKAKA